ncbi:MAG: Uncharacterized protein G01um101438_755 [Parcubacteria group bacterium Gr01-1014_38]|nr:MAG: Uncharacterized protein G01um101438_755 [Parcubacteria group bacterium Gr01-1014_38]
MVSSTHPISARRRRIALPLVYFLLPVAVFLVTSLPGVNRLTPFLALVLVGALLVLRFSARVGPTVTVLLWTLAVLSLVGSTGWFFSPFFFALYLLGIALGFVYTPGVAVAFTLALITLFAFSIGEVSPTYDFLTLLSLLSVIPITMGLRRSFLLVQQEKKGILILEAEGKPPSGITSLDAILRNQVNRVGVVLRQPLTYVKQGLALLAEGKLNEPEYQETLPRMRKAVEDLFTIVKEFESGTTKNVLLGRTSRDTEKNAD